MEKQTVYHIKYSFDNRVKAVHAVEEPLQDPTKETLAAWCVIVHGVLAGIGWWQLWG